MSCFRKRVSKYGRKPHQFSRKALVTTPVIPQGEMELEDVLANMDFIEQVILNNKRPLSKLEREIILSMVKPNAAE